MNKQQELLLGLADSLEKTGGVLRALAGEAVTSEEVVEEKKTTKKTAKKAEKKAAKKTTKKATKKEEPKEEEVSEARGVFRSDDAPPANPAEIKLFKTQWKELGKEGQARYLAGEIDSLGEELEASEEGGDDFDDLDDMPVVDEEDQWTFEEVKAEAGKYAKKHGKPAVIKIFKDMGYSKIADADPKDYPALMGAMS